MDSFRQTAVPLWVQQQYQEGQVILVSLMHMIPYGQVGG